MSTLNPITVAVIQEGMIAIVREMRVNLMRTAFSSVIYESQDYSCALLDAAGQLAAQAEDNPSHIFPMPFSTRNILERFAGDIHPGDVFIVNDPYIGGTHLNDVAIVAPCFIGGRLAMIPVVRAHWGDIGGMLPGSISGKAVEILQEGLRIPPIKVYEAGKPNQAFLELLFANVRVPDDRRGDFNAMLSTCHVAEQRLQELAKKHGLDTLLECTARLISDGEAQMRAAVARLRPGEYLYENYLDSSGGSNQPLPVRLRLTVSADSIHADFTGSSPQVQGPTNSGLAVGPTGVFVMLKSFLNPATPINEGSFKPISILAPEGTVMNARYPAACGGFSEVRRCVEAAVLGCLSQAIPELVTGDTKGGANHCMISSTDPQTRHQYLFYEYPAGGTGGWKGADGNSATRIFTEGDFSSIQPVESIEAEHPLLVERCELRNDSCGHGLRRGGLGLRRDVVVRSDRASLSVLSDRNVIPPFGVCGGLPGAPNRFTVIREGVRIEPSEVPGKVSGFALRKGDHVLMETSGGGGYGDPLEREPELVARDVAFEYISSESAQAIYGVVTRDGRVDPAATADLRRKLKGARKLAPISVGAVDEFREGLRLLRLSMSASQSLGIGEGDLVEIPNPNGASVRAWAVVDGTVAGDKAVIGPLGAQISGCRGSSSVEIRLLRRAEGGQASSGAGGPAEDRYVKSRQ